MTRKAIKTDKAPAALGPYSQGVVANNMLFISGQLPLDPATGQFVEGDMAEHTRQILKNMQVIAKEAGAELDQIVKTTIFLTDLNDFQTVNGAYAEYFTDNPPARSTVQVAALPLGSKIEIEAILAL